MIASVDAATILGARGHQVTVEVHVSRGLPAFTMLGLPDESCREARDRVRAAVMSAGYPWPDKKVVVNLAPPQFRKTGSGLDVAIAVGILVATEDIPHDAIRRLAFVGELGLDGSVRPVPGVAPMVGVRPDQDWVVPAGCVTEARVVSDAQVRSVSSLRELVEALTLVSSWPEPVDVPVAVDEPDPADLADVRGQPVARKALEIAAAGGHHLLFVGSPGSGKTMLAERLPGLLPDLDGEVALQTTMIHSAAGTRLPPSGLITRPPFRAPHHSSSLGSLVGGGGHQHRPGEISLAHGGVLFLDEMGQFAPNALDGLREALETGQIMVGRVEQQRIPMPARFQLVGATNPCPCGGGAPGACECDARAKQRYMSRLSGPLLDRFDLRIPVERPEIDQILDGRKGEPTSVVAARVASARAVALQRAGRLNATLDDDQLAELAPLAPAASQHLRSQLERGRLTARGYHRVRRVSRTLADLAGLGDEPIPEDVVVEALSMRARVGFASVGQAA